jgi:hypothetical protein
MWLFGGDDRQAAAGVPGRESASARKARKDEEGRARAQLKANQRRAKAVDAADRAGRATLAAYERRRFGRW